MLQARWAVFARRGYSRTNNHLESFHSVLKVRIALIADLF